MVFFRRRRDRDQQAQQASKEPLDQYHSRASFDDGEHILLAPGNVLDNITEAMERVDLDVNTEISFLEDVATEGELVGMIADMRLGRVLAVHVVNTAMRIMTARYPTRLATSPLPPGYDLRKILPQFTFSDHEHDVARAIFNERATSPVDLSEDDVTNEFAGLDVPEQTAVVMALSARTAASTYADRSRTCGPDTGAPSGGRRRRVGW